MLMARFILARIPREDPFADYNGWKKFWGHLMDILFVNAAAVICGFILSSVR